MWVVYDLMQRFPLQRRGIGVPTPRLVMVELLLGSTDSNRYELFRTDKQSVRLQVRQPPPNTDEHGVILHASSIETVLTPLAVYDVQPAPG